MNLVRDGNYSQILIPNDPLHATCEHCQAERPFRMLSNVRFRHVGYLLRWDFDEDLLRVCAACNHAYKMSPAEIRRVLPTWMPAATKERRRLVRLFYFVPIVLYVIAWYLAKFFGR